MSINILAQDSQNGNAPHATPPASFEIMVNRKLNFGRVYKTKASVKRNTWRHRDKLEQWKKETVDVESLADILSEGNTIQPGIFESGTSAEDVTHFGSLWLDFDSSPVKETILNPLSTYACMWYYSPSYKLGENEKHRLGFRLSRDVNRDEAERLLEYLIASYKTCDSLLDSNRIFYGSFPGGVTILSETATLDVDTFLMAEITLTLEIPEEEDGEEDTTPPPTPPTALEDGVKAGVGVLGAALRWIAKEIWYDKCGKDINKLFCLNKNKLEEQKKGEKWHGHRPEDTEKNHGSGFLVYWYNPELPPTFKSYNNPDLPGNSYNFIEYWWYYGNKLHGKNWGAFDSDNYEKCANFKLVCDDIARHFGVEPFPFEEFKQAKAKQRKEKQEQKTKEFTSQVDNILQTYVYVLKKGAKDSYIYWDFTDGIWRTKPEYRNVFTDCVKPGLIKEYGADEVALNDPKTAGFIEAHIKRFHKFKSIEDKIDFDEMRNPDVIPLKNGDWNWRTKTFTESFNHENFNMTRSPRNFIPLTPPASTPGVELLMRWLDDMEYSENQKRGVRAWIIVNCLGIATRTGRMLNVYGTPETGKTVIGQIIQGCLGSLCATVRGKTLTDSGNRFANQSIDGKFALFIDEFRADSSGWELIKQLTGNAEIIIEVEKKGMSSYNTKFFAGITTATQDKFYIPNSDDGGIRRRIVLLRHTKNMHKEHLADIDRQFTKPGIYQDIFNWAIQQDGDAAVDEFITYAKSDEAKSILQESIIDNDNTLQFMHEMITFTDDPKDVVSNHQIQTAYLSWLDLEKGISTNSKIENDVSQLTKRIREKAQIKDNGFIWKLCPDKNEQVRVTIGGQRSRGLKGLKLKPVESDLPI